VSSFGRLQTLERYGLATQYGPGLWALSKRLEAVMRDVGERNDIIKAINRALADRGEERAPGSFVLRGEEAQTPIIGRVIDKRLTDELGDRIVLIIDGIDGHHVVFRDATTTGEAKIGAIVEVSRSPSQRPADRNIAIVASGTGVYRPSDHRKLLEAASAGVRGGEYEAFVDTHVRRLEAPRRHRRAGQRRLLARPRGFRGSRQGLRCWQGPYDKHTASLRLRS